MEMIDDSELRNPRASKREAEQCDVWGSFEEKRSLSSACKSNGKQIQRANTHQETIKNPWSDQEIGTKSSVQWGIPLKVRRATPSGD